METIVGYHNGASEYQVHFYDIKVNLLLCKITYFFFTRAKHFLAVKTGVPVSDDSTCHDVAESRTSLCGSLTVNVLSYRIMNILKIFFLRVKNMAQYKYAS